MKKISTLALILIFIFSLSACGVNNDTSTTQAEISGSTTETGAMEYTETAVDFSENQNPSSGFENTSVELETERTDKSFVKGQRVFDTENITKITIYRHSSNELVIPEMYFEDMIQWLDTFTVGDEAKFPTPPGTNTFSLTVEYADKDPIHNGFDSIEIDGIIFEIDSPPEPDWWYEMLENYG